MTSLSQSCARIFTRARTTQPLHNPPTIHKSATARRTTGRFHSNTTTGFRSLHVLRAARLPEEDELQHRTKYTAIWSSSPTMGRYTDTCIQSPASNRWSHRTRGFGTAVGGKDRIPSSPTTDTNREGENTVPSSPPTTPTKPPSSNIFSPISFLLQKYGRTFLTTYLTLYLVTLSTIFTLLDSQMIDPATFHDLPSHLPWHSGTGAEEELAAAEEKEFRGSVDMVAGWLDRYKWTEGLAELVRVNPRVGNLAIAWVGTKVTEPVRVMVTMMVVKRLRRYLGWGEEGGVGIGK